MRNRGRILALFLIATSLAPSSVARASGEDPFPGLDVTCNGSVARNRATAASKAPNTFDLRLSCIYGPPGTTLEWALIKLDVHSSVGRFAFVIPIGSDAPQTQWNEGLLRNGQGHFRGAYPFRLSVPGPSVQPKISLTSASLAGCFPLGMPGNQNDSAEIASLGDGGSQQCTTGSMSDGAAYPPYPTCSCPIDWLVTPATSDTAITTRVVRATSTDVFRSRVSGITSGSRVSWLNTSMVTHTVRSVRGSWVKDATIRPGERTSHTFTSPGTYRYRCSLHEGMTGKVVVT